MPAADGEIQEKWFPGGKITVPQLEGVHQENSGNLRNAWLRGACDEKDGAGVMKGLDGSESTGLSPFGQSGTFPARPGKRRSTISARVSLPLSLAEDRGRRQSGRPGKKIKDAIFEDMNMFPDHHGFQT